MLAKIGPERRRRFKGTQRRVYRAGDNAKRSGRRCHEQCGRLTVSRLFVEEALLPNFRTIMVRQ